MKHRHSHWHRTRHWHMSDTRHIFYYRENLSFFNCQSFISCIISNSSIFELRGCVQMVNKFQRKSNWSEYPSPSFGWNNHLSYFIHLFVELWIYRSQDPFSLEIAGLRQKEKYLSLDTACEFSSKVKYWFSNLILLFIEILIGTYGFDCLFVCVVLSIDTIYWIAWWFSLLSLDN